jgi:hypothetical protein
MGWLFKIFIGILLCGILAICADIVTWLYEEPWVILIILGCIILLIAYRVSPIRKRKKIKTLLNSALIDGKLTDKEKQTIIRRAKKLGMDADEVEIYIDKWIYTAKRKNSIKY